MKGFSQKQEDIFQSYFGLSVLYGTEVCFFMESDMVTLGTNRAMVIAAKCGVQFVAIK